MTCYPKLSILLTWYPRKEKEKFCPELSDLHRK